MSLPRWVVTVTVNQYLISPQEHDESTDVKPDTPTDVKPDTPTDMKPDTPTDATVKLESLEVSLCASLSHSCRILWCVVLTPSKLSYLQAEDPDEKDARVRATTKVCVVQSFVMVGTLEP